MQILTDQTFDEIVAKHEWLAIDFGAPSCTPCIPFKKTLESLEQSYANRLTFVALNADDEPETAIRFGVRGLPTLLILHHGVEVGRTTGNQLRDKIQKFIDGILN